jgi:hypothetical protein
MILTVCYSLRIISNKIFYFREKNRLHLFTTAQNCVEEPWMVEVPCKDPHDRTKTTTMKVPVILPHELLSWLAENGRFYIAPNIIKDFWDRWKQFKPYHPATDDGIHNPVAISGDDAKYTLGGAKIIIICISLVCLDRAKRSQSNDIRTRGQPYFFLKW